MKKACFLIALALAVSAAVTAQAATITWGSAQNITGATDVLNTGIPVCAYAFGTDAGVQTVNGVVFAVGGIGGGGADVTVTGGVACGPYFPLSSPAGYNGILKGAVFNSSGPGLTVTLNNLVEGQAYAVQVWSANVDYGGSDTTYDGAVSLAMRPTGQYAIGTFIADAAGSQTMILTGANYQINALQLQKVVAATTTTTTTTVATTTTTTTTTTVAATTTTTTTAGIAWGSAQNITGATDVLNTGTPVYAYAFGTDVGAQIVNGVAFAVGGIGGGGADVTVTGGAACGAYFPLSSPTGYNGILRGAVFASSGSGATMTVTLNNLVEGQQYAVQVWSANVDYGGTDTTYDGTVSLSVTPTGQYAIGTFTAKASGSQVITLTANNIQLNALQLQKVVAATTTTTTVAGTTTTTTTVAATTTTTTTAGIVWGAAQNITGDADVLTTGALVYAHVFGGTSDSVNGVPFVSDYTPNVTLTPHYGLNVGAYFTPPGLSVEYVNVLKGAAFDSRAGGTEIDVTLKNLSIGTNYAVQVWVSNYPYGGANVVYDGTPSVSLAQTVSTLGQYSIGTFTAGAATQVMKLTSDNVQINAIQVREPGATTTTTTTVATTTTTTTVAGTTTTTVAGTTTTTTATAGIAWGAAKNITGATDVLNMGTPVYAYAFGTDVGAQTVNGVDFSVAGFGGDGINVTVTGGLLCGPYFPASSPAGYNGILKGAQFGNTGPGGGGAGLTVTLNNLVEGQAYAVQVWSANVDYGGTDTTIDGAVSLAMRPGQYAIGTFIADATRSQLMSLTGGNYQINALQVRTPPPPVTVIILR